MSGVMPKKAMRVRTAGSVTRMAPSGEDRSMQGCSGAADIAFLSIHDAQGQCEIPSPRVTGNGHTQPSPSCLFSAASPKTLRTLLRHQGGRDGWYMPLSGCRSLFRAWVSGLSSLLLRTISIGNPYGLCAGGARDKGAPPPYEPPALATAIAPLMIRSSVWFNPSSVWIAGLQSPFPYHEKPPGTPFVSSATCALPPASRVSKRSGMRIPARCLPLQRPTKRPSAVSPRRPSSFGSLLG
jgi:hypothetical protein